MLHVGRCGEVLRVTPPHHAAALDQKMAVGDANERADILVDHQNREAQFLETGEARARSRRGSAAPDPRSPRPGSAGADWSSARGRSPASAARRRKAGCPYWRRAQPVAGTARRPCRVSSRRRRVPPPSPPDSRARVRLGKICRPSGTRPMPSLAILYDGRPRISRAGKADGAGARRRETQDRAHGGGLAHAVAPHQRHHLAGLDRQRDAEQHLAEAVAGLDAGDVEHIVGHGVSHGPCPPPRPDKRRARRRWRGFRPGRRWRSPGRRPAR